MTADRYPLHHHSEVDVPVDAQRLFDYLDDHHRLAGHMEKPSLMMAGATMYVETDALRGQSVGSVIRITGRVLGMHLSVEEAVTERIPAQRNMWETRGEPRLLVIGPYQMGFAIEPKGDFAHLTVFIDYQIPPHAFSRLVGRLASRPYAAWCTRRMAKDAVSFFTAESRETP
jgi:hypothetical protein